MATRKYIIEREAFESSIANESSKPFFEARKLASLICRHAKTYARIQEAYCNGPGDFATGKQIDRWQTEIERREANLERRIREICAELGEGFTPIFSGDPRSCTLKLKVPSGRTNDWAHEGVCVPEEQ